MQRVSGNELSDNDDSLRRLLEEFKRRAMDAQYQVAAAARLAQRAWESLPPQEPAIAGHPLSGFKSKPFLHVAHGSLHDGRNGKAMATAVKGAHRLILSELLVKPPVHEIEVMGLQAKPPFEDIEPATYLRRAPSTISKVGKTARALGCSITHVCDDIHERMWILDFSQSPADFSTKLATETAAAAQQACHEDRLDDALELALTAIQEDELVPTGHEVLGDVAVRIGLDRLPDETCRKLVRSVRFLADRKARCYLMAKTGRAAAIDEGDGQRLLILSNGWEAEGDRLSAIASPIEDWMRRSSEAVEERRLDAVVVVLREEPSLGADPYADPRFQDVCDARMVRFARAKVLDMVCKRRKVDMEFFQQRFLELLLQLIRDRTCEPELRVICRYLTDALLAEFG
jgi:hypothetical protein